MINFKFPDELATKLREGDLPRRGQADGLGWFDALETGRDMHTAAALNWLIRFVSVNYSQSVFHELTTELTAQGCLSGGAPKQHVVRFPHSFMRELLNGPLRNSSSHMGLQWRYRLSDDTTEYSDEDLDWLLAFVLENGSNQIYQELQAIISKQGAIPASVSSAVEDGRITDATEQKKWFEMFTLFIDAQDNNDYPVNRVDNACDAADRWLEIMRERAPEVLRLVIDTATPESFSVGRSQLRTRLDHRVLKPE